jgi:hypothetical protein
MKIVGGAIFTFSKSITPLNIEDLDDSLDGSWGDQSDNPASSWNFVLIGN